MLFIRLISLPIFVLCFLASCKGQKTFGTDRLKLIEEIPMPDVKGRIDHMAFDPKGQILYVAALGNNSVEAIDLKNASLRQSFKEVEQPQGIAYLAEQNEIAVASGGNGECIFFNASTFEKVATLHLSSDADNVRYDATGMKLYVGYGDGGLALIDPIAHKQIGDVKLPAHPESFQIDRRNALLFVNLPDDQSIAVIDSKNFILKGAWKTNSFKANFPMTLDTADGLVIVGYRHPSTLIAYDSKSGSEISHVDLVGDVDDIFYYADKKLLIASGGEGYINIFEEDAGNRFKQIANIGTRDGARTSLLVPSLKYYILAARAVGGKSASILVYQISG